MSSLEVPGLDVSGRVRARDNPDGRCRVLMISGAIDVTDYDVSVRPGEAVLKVFEIETESRRPAYSHARHGPISAGAAARNEDALQRIGTDGMPERPVIEVIVPVTVTG